MEKKVLNYRIIIEKEKYEDGTPVYVAYCPTLDISDYGDTVEDALSSIKDGIELTIQSLVKEKKEVPIDHVDDQLITTTQVQVPPYTKISFT